MLDSYQIPFSNNDWNCSFVSWNRSVFRLKFKLKMNYNIENGVNILNVFEINIQYGFCVLIAIEMILMSFV